MSRRIKWYYNVLLPLALFIMSLSSCSLFQGNEVYNLQTDFMINPVGTDNSTPRFSWAISSKERGVMQDSYQIKVSKQDGTVVWDSGIVNSSDAANISYSGNALEPSTRYFWTVEVVDNKGNTLKSNEKAYFETGLMSSGWDGAQWIQYANNGQLGNGFDLELDMTLKSDNIGIIFGAADPNNMHMWSVNTKDNEYPVLRRHLCENGNFRAEDISLKDFFTKEDLIDKECHLKISVRGNVIQTYIADKQVDTYDSPALKGKYIGFRAFKGNEINEHAYIDNIVLTSYKNDTESFVVFKEDFEKGSNDFEGVETIAVDGNTKLNVYSHNNDNRFLQGAAVSVPMFRTEIQLSKPIESARIYSSGLGIYDMFINGKRVGQPMDDGSVIYDELKPGWTDYSKTVFYSTYDVTKLLNSGANVIGAIVSSGWYNGGIARGQYGHTELGFMAKLLVTYKDGTADTFVTNTDTWVSSKESPVRMADIYHGETYDARYESDWSGVGYDASEWTKTAINTSFRGEIEAFIGTPVRVRPELDRLPQHITVYEGIKENGSTFGEVNVVNTVDRNAAISLKKGQTAIIDFGQNIVGWVHFKVKGDSGNKVRFRFSEMLNDSGERSRRNDNAKGTLYLENLRGAKASLYYTMKGVSGGEEFRPSMSFFGFRYCEITADEDVVVEKIKGEVITSVEKEMSTFQTNDKRVNQLYSNVVWGQRGNFVSVPTDCPQRDERLGWTGDTQVFCRTAAYNANMDAFFHKWMGDMRDSQRGDGAYPAVAPNILNEFGGTAWADAGIIVPWTMYLMYADKVILADNYASMQKYMDFLANQKTEEYQYNGSIPIWGDWLSYEPTEGRFISVCYYAYAADMMSKIAVILGKNDDSQAYRVLYNNVKDEFRKRYIEADGSLKEKSQTAYLLALKLDMFSSEKDTKQALDSLLKKIADNGYRLSTGFVGTATLNQTLSDMGATDMAYNLLLQRADPSWLYSVDQGATTIWERWNSYTIEKGFGDSGMNSFNHYAYGAVAEWMFRYMAGIDTDEKNPGFKHIILHPNPDTRKELPQGQEHITMVDAVYGSVYGDIKSKWNMDTSGGVVYEITIPANTTATVFISQIKENSYIYENKTRAEDVEGVVSVKDENGKFILELNSGSYVFNVE